MADADRSTAVPIRYVACHPGALLHQDHKKLGRAPDGGGHRVHGWQPGRPHRGLGYEHFEVVIDDHSRVGFVIPVLDERPASAVHALELAAAEFARLGVRIERVLTDNGGSYRSHAYAAALATLGARHKRTRPYRPQTNGEAERFIKSQWVRLVWIRSVFRSFRLGDRHSHLCVASNVHLAMRKSQLVSAGLGYQGLGTVTPVLSTTSSMSAGSGVANRNSSASVARETSTTPA